MSAIDQFFAAALSDSYHVHSAMNRMIQQSIAFPPPPIFPVPFASSGSGFGRRQPAFGRRSSANLPTPVAAGVRTPIDDGFSSTHHARPIRNTLARDGIVPQITRGTSHRRTSSTDAVDVTQPTTVPTHTLPAVAASKLIKGNSRSSTSIVRSRRAASASNARQSSSSTSSSTASGAIAPAPSASIGGSWIKTQEGNGRARWNQAMEEIKLEGTSNSLFMAVHNELRNQGICSTGEWNLTCELKATGAAYLLMYADYEPFSSSSDSITSSSNSSQLSFLSVCCNTALKTWSIEFKRPSSHRTSSSPSIILGTVKDETLSANKYYHCQLSMTQGNVFTLQVDGHTFFDRITLGCLDSTVSQTNSSSVTSKVSGRSFGIGVVRSKVHLRGFHLRERGLSDQHASSTAAARPSSNQRNQPYSVNTVAYANGHPVSDLGVSTRTAAVFGSTSSLSNELIRPSSTVTSTESINSFSSPSAAASSRTSQPNQLQPSSTLSHDDTPAPRPAYSSAIHGDDPKLIELIESSIINRDLNVGLDDIASLAEAKQVLREAVIMPLLLPEFFQGIRQPTKGVLLHGPAGTGKTMLAKAIANVSEVTFFNVNSSILTSKWRGESEKLVTCLFNMARFYAPSIIFLDEIDSLFMTRGTGSEHEASRAFKAVMFQQIDGLLSAPSSSSTEPAKSQLVMLLATSNCPWDLDQAIRRRLEKRIYIPLPDAISRRDIFRLHLRDIHLAPDIDFDELVTKTDGYSGADLKIISRDASMAPFRTLVAGKTPTQIRDLKSTPGALNFQITQHDFLTAVARVQPSVAAQDTKRFEDWQKEFGSI